MRSPPADKNGMTIKPPEVKLRMDRSLVTWVRHYQLITPLFGGGVEPAVHDPVTLIRGSAIRGHLRFWWRACRGGQFGGSLTDMKAAEDRLWGAASTWQKPRPSQVHVTVETTAQGQNEQPWTEEVDRKTGQPRRRVSDGWGFLAYAAFPLQERLGKVRAQVGFTATLTFPDSYQADVEAALWAWETFGGIGARTRRGFGALRNVGVPLPDASPDRVKEHILAGLRQHLVAGPWPAGVPHLSATPRMRITTPRGDPRAAWEYLIRRLQTFRQMRGPGTTPNRPGRSHWPEADAIRSLTKRRCSQHATPVSAVGKFPRAAFGLPIVFHFKDAGDPDETALQGRDHDHLASPLILRPLACTNNQGIGLALVLGGTTLPPGGLTLKHVKREGSYPVEATVTADEAGKIAPLRGHVDVLQAFLDTL